MRLQLIRPNRPDINAQYRLLRPAFNQVRDAKLEFDFCCDAVAQKQASLYHLKGKGVSVRFVGIVTSDNDYLILAMTGNGLVAAAPIIIDAVKSQGYRAIKYHTVRQGMKRILQRFGFSMTATTEHDTVMTLYLEGC
ncbi:hypothetical protein [Photobacterium nomapromontoriensis]|uniref:hypothetical protein n=1 Tax=Photobacterium nomapromontoriensis TaxID=2910237 RepID=UPI003D0E2203